MSPSPEQAPARRDDGFSLIEIVVALGILMLVVVTLLPQLIVGIQATGTARLVSQAKGIAQAEQERMRNLPYHISFEAGNFRDVLDFYYKDLAAGTAPTCTNGSGGFAPPQASWTGYVSATATRCAYEPSGAFYRTVKTIAPAPGIAGFTIVIDTQFLSGATPPQPVTPPSGYNTQSTANGRPASHQIGVTITVLYADRATLRPATSYTQISDQLPSVTRVRAEANATAVEVGSVTLDNGQVTLSSGLVNLAGSLTHASTVAANVAGVSAGLATGETSGDTVKSVTAPPSTTAGVHTPPANSLGTTGCQIVCWGGTRLDLPALTAAQGLPNAGSVTSPVQGLVTDTTQQFSFGNSAADDYRTSLGLQPPLVKLDPDGTAVGSGLTSSCTPGTSGAASYSTASGYLRTTEVNAAVDPAVVDACVVARSSSLSFFPVAAATAETPNAPRGIVLVELRHASARCQVRTTAHTPTTSFDYEAVVKYWNGTAYQTAATVTPATATDPLDSIDLATTSVGGSKFLGDYIASWSALTGAEVTATTTGGSATVKVPGVVTIVSQPVREDATAEDGLDASSAVALTLGALSCSATDAR